MNLHNCLQIKPRRKAETNRIISTTPLRKCAEARLVSNSILTGEFQWKRMTRFFRTTGIVANTFQLVSAERWNTRCQSSVGLSTCIRATTVESITHILRLCPNLSACWREDTATGHPTGPHGALSAQRSAVSVRHTGPERFGHPSNGTKDTLVMTPKGPL